MGAHILPYWQATSQRMRSAHGPDTACSVNPGNLARQSRCARKTERTLGRDTTTDGSQAHPEPCSVCKSLIFLETGVYIMAVMRESSTQSVGVHSAQGVWLAPTYDTRTAHASSSAAWTSWPGNGYPPTSDARGSIEVLPNSHIKLSFLTPCKTRSS
jgi:hypothetical protein